MDVAGGPGRYLLEVIADNPGKDLEVICRDLNEAGLDRGRAQAEKSGINNIKYEKADAFSLDGLRSASPKPHRPRDTIDIYIKMCYIFLNGIFSEAKSKS